MCLDRWITKSVQLIMWRIMNSKDEVWEYRKKHDDPEKPRGYLVAIAGWFPGDKLIID